jgi:hypothetical protein
MLLGEPLPAADCIQPEKKQQQAVAFGFETMTCEVNCQSTACCCLLLLLVLLLLLLLLLSPTCSGSVASQPKPAIS